MSKLRCIVIALGLVLLNGAWAESEYLSMEDGEKLFASAETKLRREDGNGASEDMRLLCKLLDCVQSGDIGFLDTLNVAMLTYYASSARTITDNAALVSKARDEINSSNAAVGALAVSLDSGTTMGEAIGAVSARNLQNNAEASVYYEKFIREFVQYREGFESMYRRLSERTKKARMTCEKPKAVECVRATSPQRTEDPKQPEVKPTVESSSAGENEDPVDQYNMGVNYERGQGVKKDIAEALKWYLKSAAQGYAPAENNIGWIYYIGNGVEVDYDEAVKWFKRSAAKNCHLAQESLGRCYFKGRGVTQDYDKAFQLFLASANQMKKGTGCAGFGVAKCYWFGYGCEKNVGKALAWLAKSSEAGDRDAQYQRGRLLEKENPAEAMKWFKKAAAQNHVKAALKVFGMGADSVEGDWEWTDEDPNEVLTGSPP